MPSSDVLVLFLRPVISDLKDTVSDHRSQVCRLTDRLYSPEFCYVRRVSHAKSCMDDYARGGLIGQVQAIAKYLTVMFGPRTK